MNDNKRKLYDALSQEYDMGTFEQFSTDIEDEAKRRKLYESIKGTYDLPDFNGFSSQLGIVAAQPQQTEQKQEMKSVGDTVVKPVVPTFTEQQLDSMERTPMASDTVLQQGEQFREAADQMGSRAAEDEEVVRAKQGLLRDQVGNTLPEIEQRLDSTYNAAVERAREATTPKSGVAKFVHDIFTPNPDKPLSGLFNRGVEHDIARKDPEVQALTTAKQYLDDSRSMIAAADRGDENFFKGAARGFGEKFMDLSTWDFGITELENNKTLRSALDKADNGEELTDAERSLLDAAAVKTATDMYFGSYLSRGYKAGSVTAESIPFMIEMAANPLSATGKTAASKMLRYTINRFGRKAATSGLGKAGLTVARGVGDIAGAAGMAATTGSVRVAADAERRQMGDVQFNENPDADRSAVFTYGGHTEGDDYADAWRKAFLGTTIENYSEMVGAYFAPALNIAGKGVRKGLDKIGLKKVNEFVDNVSGSDLGRLVSDFESRTQWNGTIGEYAEEVAGGIMNALLVGDQTLDTDERTGVFNLDNNIDTFLGVSLMGGFFSAIKTAGYRTPKYRARQDMKAKDDAAAAAFGNQEKWGEIRNTIAFGTDEDVAQKIKDIINDTDLTQEQRQSALEYVKAATTYKGMLKGEEIRRADEDPLQVDAETSFDNGYGLSGDQERNDAKNMLDYQRQKAVDTFGEIKGLDEDPIATLQTMRDGGYTPEQLQVAIDYVNAKATYDGMIQHVRDDIDGRIATSDALIESRRNHDDGMIHPATMKTDDRKVYVIGGKLVMNEDGTTIDHDQSDESVIIRDAVTGAIEFADPHDILSTDEALDAAQEKEAAQEAIRQQYAQEAANKIDGVLPFNNGDAYQVMDEQGQQHTVTVIPTGTVNSQGQVLQAGDGEAVVSIDGAEPVPMSREAIQQMFDNANLARLQQFEQEQAAHREEQSAAEREANRPVYNINDEVTLQTEEGAVRGSITAEANEDGQYEVYTEEPINGKKINLFTRDELDNMLIEHNGNVAPQVQPTENESAVLPQGTTENGAGLDNAGGEAGAANGTGANNPPATALSRIPILRDSNDEPILNRKGKPTYLWHEAPVGDTADALTEQAGGVMLTARDVATDMVGKAKEQLEKVRKQKPKGEDPIELIESRNAIRQSEQQAQDIVKYWQDVNQEIQKRMREESARKQAASEAAKSEEQKAREAEEKRQQEERLNEIERQRLREAIEKDHERRNREYEPMTKARKEMANDPDALGILDDTEPRDLEEWVSSLLLPHSILWQDASENEVGLRSELGLKRGDMQRFMNLLGTKENGAKPFGEVVLDIYEGLPERMKEQYTDQDVRNTLLELFNEGSSGRMMNLTKEHRIEEAREVLRENLRREQEAEMEAWAKAYHLRPDERETFEEWMQIPPSEVEQDIINQIIADNEQQQDETGAGLGEQPDAGGVQAGVAEGEDEIQQTTAGPGEVAEGAELAGGTEGGGSQPSVPGDEVAGGASANTVGAEVAAEWLIGSGQNAINSTDYLLKALSGVFRKATGAIEAIRQKYAQQFAASDAAEISDFVNSGIYSQVISDIRNAIESAYPNNADARFILDTILQYPTGLPTRLGQDISRRIDNLDSQVAPAEQLKPTDLRDAVRPEPADGKESPVTIAEREVNVNPTTAQKEAGNYKKGHVKIDGYDISIENPKGSIRRGTAHDGTEWEQRMNNTYGYIRGTEGVDGDHIDVFLSDSPEEGNVYVIDQRNADGSFDEHKVMYGFNSAEEARQAYLSNYEEGWQGLGAITEVSKDEFKKWVNSSHRKTKPFAEYKSVKPLGDQNVSHIEQGNERKSAVEPEFEAKYQISPKPYTTKKGKVLNLQLVKFADELKDKVIWTNARQLAKDLKGWWSREDGGFLMRDAETAQQLADTVLSQIGNNDAMEQQLRDERLSLSDMALATDEAQNVEAVDAQQEAEALTQQPPQEAQGSMADNGYGANNTLVSRDRYEELKERMHKKMLEQLNMGIDPEILAIGTEMAAFHIEAGARKFADFAKKMIEDLGDAIRPYLKSFYNGARDLPEVEKAGYTEEMSPYDEVKKFDVANFDKASTDSMAAAEQVMAEQEAARQADEAKEKIAESKPKTTPNPLRPATEADFDNAHLVVYYDGKPYGVIAVVRSGEQISATQFSQPHIESVVLTNGKSVNLDNLQVSDEATAATQRIREIAEKGSKSEQKRGKATPSKKKSVSLQQEPDLFGSFGEDATHVESLNDNSNGHARTDAVRSEGLPADGTDSGELGLRADGKGAGQESGRTDRRGAQGGVEPVRQRLHDGLRPSEQLASTPSAKPQGARQPLERPNNPKNTHNNHAERGKDYAPRGVDARIDANIKAIELMKQLMDSGEQATPEQMAVLRQFSGWGGLGKAFSSTPQSGATQNTSMKLRELLGEEAYQQANMSRNSAYYTPANVIDALWDVARAMGFKGGRVLEGSAGIGNILGLMPTDMSERSDIHAVEIDQTTGNILSLLYPDAKVDVQGFEATQVENGSVDLAITNVPFVTGLRVNDTTGDKDLSKKFHDIHDFCIAKNVRKLREGGIGIFITSSGTLDNSARLREWIVQEGGADVVGAFRLNNETFGGTGATSDIIVIRKRVNGKKSPHAIDVLSTTGERTAEYDTGETKKVKGEEIPIIKQLSMDYNSYFVEHPEMMGGEMHFNFEMGETRYPTSRSLFPVKGKNQADMLKSWSQSFDGKDWGEVATVSQPTEQAIYEELGEGVKEGSMVVSNGQLCIAQRGKAVPLAVNANKVKGHSKVECFEAYLGIKKALSDLLQYQTDVEDDSGLQPLLKALNKAYDDFVKTYGHLHKNTSISFLKSDVDFANILALEKFSERGDVKTGKRIQEFGKTDIFSQRVVEKEKAPEPTNVQDGIIASIYVHGRVDVSWIVEQLNRHGGETAMHTEEEVKAEIVRSGLGFENPVTRQMEVSYEYLSGNVREKLAQAQANNADGQYDANIKALEAVVPMDIPAHLIDFSIGSSWIDPKLYEEYVKEKTDIDVTFTSAGGTWFMRTPYSVSEQKNRAMGVVSELLHKTIMGTQLIEAAMQNKTITVSETHKKWDGSTETITDKEATQACSNKIDEIRQDFKEWARAKMQSDPAMSERIERIYNDMFNNYVPRAIPDEFVPAHFGGAATTVDGKPFSLRPHQGKAVIRGTMQPLLLAHEVGSGKTYTLISTAMEMRRLGTARKPMIVVQNATVGQFVESAKKLYPNAKVLTLEDKDHTGEGRKNFYAKIKYNDWDMIVVPQSVFERIPDSEERQMKFVQDKIEEKMLVLEQMRDADPDSNSWIVKQAEKEIDKLEDELAGLTDSISSKRKERDEKKEAVTRQNAEVKALEMLDRQTDDVENFDDMGIDAILVDEAHEYKHLGFATAMQRGVKGVDPSYSKKAQGVYLKTQAVLEKNNGRNVVFATGTPISNTAAEIWTFMRYLMPADMMKEYGIYYFDDFVRNFGNLQQMLEFTTSGKFKENNRFAGYVNLPELVRIWAGVADTVLNEDIEKQRIAEGGESKIPEMEDGKATDIYLPQTRALRSVMKYVKKQLDDFDKMSGKDKKANSHIPLTMYGIAKAAAVDARLVVSDAADEPQSKTNEAVRQTLRSLRETESYSGTVALFADNYQNKRSGFNLYEDIREKLIAQGVPAEQIVVMKSGMSVKKKLEIFDKVNRGEIRVIMGSTFTLGTGVNIQERLHTLIHLDAPNRPMDYTQRNGRILRQGNLHKEMGKPVRVLRFGVEDSLDVTAYQRLKTKGAIADSIMNGKQMMSNSMENRALEEEEDVFGDTVAQLSGSEYAMLKNQAEKDVRKYEAKKKQYQADQTYCHNEIPRLEGEIKTWKSSLDKYRKNLAIVEAVPQHTEPSITVGKQTFPSIEAMADFIKEYNKSIKEAENDLRDNPSLHSQTRRLTVNVGGIDFEFTTEQNVETKEDQGTLFSAVRRKMTYSCEALGLTDVPVHQSLLREGLEDIVKNVISGQDFREGIERSERIIDKNEKSLAQVRERHGKPFEFEKELEQAHERFDEYSELMKKELEEKEKKYAEMDADVEEASDISEADEADDETEDEDSDVHFRDGEDDVESINEQFNRELQMQIDGTLPQGHIYDMGMPSDILLSTGIANVPIQLNSTRLESKSSQFGHDFALSEIKDLVKAINDPVAIFAYGDKEKAQNIIVEIQKEGNNFVVGLSIRPSVNGRVLEVNSIRNVFPKKNAEWLNWINQGKLLYVDKEKIQNLINQQRTILADVEYLDLDSAAKVVENFENPKLSEENLREREGDSSSKRLTYEESLAISRRAGYTKKQHDAWQERAWRHMHEAAESTVERLGLGGRVTIMETPDGLKGRKAKAKGWFDAKTGKIVVVLGNHHSVSDVVKTILHEGVAHYGLRKLFGQHFDQFLDNVYQYGDESVRREIVELAKKHGWDFREATEEYLARLAEDTDFERATNQGWWSKIKSLFLDMLHHIGLGDYGGAILTNNELRYILWRSYENMAEPGRYRNPFREAEDISMQMRLGVGSFDRERARIHSLGRIDNSRQIAAESVADGGGRVLFRDGDFSERDRAIARDRYEKMVSEGLYQFQEAVQDSMLGLKKLYDAILSPKGKVHMEDVEGYENAYLAENRMSSVNAAEQHDYYLRFMQPLLKAIGSIAGNKKGARQALTDYMMAKHGLERNRVFAERDAREVEANGGDFNDAYQKFREKDYSGLTALTGEDDVVAAEAAAQQIVDDYEAAYDTADLWDRTREATQATLEKIYRSGLLSKERYEQIRDMFEYYIPLQGWDETTSDEVYGYLTSKSGPFGGSPIKHAAGRSSKADDPIATIAMMADAAIRQGNRNLMKQRFLNFVLNHPSDLVSVHDLWLEYDAATDEWIPVFADLEDGDTAADVERKVEAFEQRMEQLAEAEPDRYKRGREAQGIPYKVVKGNLKEHQVLVKRGGRTYVLTINGNPRAAQALNGLTNPDVEQGGVVGNMLKAGEWVNRHLSAFYTTRNPDFVVSNFFRDMLYSNCMTWVKESPRYALRYHKNFGMVANPVMMRRLLGKWEKGTLDMSNRLEKMFYQFMINGGETGYTSVRDIEEHKREIAKELKKQGSMSRKAWSALGMQLDLLNRSVENCARFAAFVTSREMGRSIDRSIYDAKEVSVNFNKKGSGGKMVNATGQTLLGKVGSYVGGGGRLAYVFWNAGVQGLTNFGRAGKRHGGKAFAGAATMFILGYVIPQLAAAMGGGDGDDDDKNAYYNLPEYVRRSNICFRVGDQWVTIPLPIEFRGIYGLGELASGAISGNEHYDNKELSYQIVSQVSQILPLDMLEGGGGVSPWVPSSAKPFVEAYVMNKGWTGLPIYKDTPWNQNDPEWTKAYKNADQSLVGASKWLNEKTGGDDFKKGAIDINPAKLEYLLSGVFGGYVNTAEKLKKMGETALGNREFDWRNMLLANRVVKTGDERTANRKLQNEYFKYKKEYEETSRLMRKYEDAADEGVAGMAEKVDFLYNSPEYLRYELFDEYKADIDDYREDLQEATDDAERKEIEAEMYATMRELIDQLHEIK